MKQQYQSGNNYEILCTYTIINCCSSFIQLYSITAFISLSFQDFTGNYDFFTF